MNNDSLAGEVAKGALPISVSTLKILGIPVSDVVCVITIIYTLVLIICKIHSEFFSEAKK